MPCIRVFDLPTLGGLPDCKRLYPPSNRKGKANLRLLVSDQGNLDPGENSAQNLD